MQIIKQKAYDLSFIEEIDKSIFLVLLLGKYYSWVQDRTHTFTKEEILSTKEGHKDIKVAELKYELYEHFLDNIHITLDNQE